MPYKWATEGGYEAVTLTTQKLEAALALMSNIRTLDLFHLNLAFVNRFLYGTFPNLRKINWNARVDELAGTFLNRHPQIKAISAGYVFLKIEDYELYDLEGKDKVVTPIRLPHLTHFHGSPRELRFVSEFTTQLETAVIYDGDITHSTNWTDNEEETLDILYQKSQGRLTAFGFRGLTWKSSSLERIGPQFAQLVALFIIYERPRPKVDEEEADDSWVRIQELLVSLKCLPQLERLAYMDTYSAFYSFDEKRRALPIYEKLYEETDTRYTTTRNLILEAGRTCRFLQSVSLPCGYGRWLRPNIKALDEWACQSADPAWSMPRAAYLYPCSILRRFKREVVEFCGVGSEFSFVFGTFE